MTMEARVGKVEEEAMTKKCRVLLKDGKTPNRIFP
jgi:hypothetical protein